RRSIPAESDRAATTSRATSAQACDRARHRAEATPCTIGSVAARAASPARSIIQPAGSRFRASSPMVNTLEPGEEGGHASVRYRLGPGIRTKEGSRAVFRPDDLPFASLPAELHHGGAPVAIWLERWGNDHFSQPNLDRCPIGPQAGHAGRQGSHPP